jgi:hypothetical protein
MNIENLYSAFRTLAPEFLSSYCVINGAIMRLQEVEQMGYNEFSYRAKINLPLKLYKYLPNKSNAESGGMTNYSIQALENNTVFMQSPCNFDDIYDSGIYIDFFEYERLRLMEYCTRCELPIGENAKTQEYISAFVQELREAWNQHRSFSQSFKKADQSEMERRSNDLFCSRLMLELSQSTELGDAVAKIIRLEYAQYIERLKTTFRTSCFTTTPYSQLMWGGSYADCHKGFCLEYTVLPNDNDYKEIYYNLFPVIYCKSRPNITSKLVSGQDGEISMDYLWDIYFHGALRKSIDWAFQNEWRLLLPMQNTNASDYNIRFFPIAKVFLGNRMEAHEREKIIDICHSKNIPYVGVTPRHDSFEMQDCKTRCEDCPKYRNSIQQ